MKSFDTACLYNPNLTKKEFKSRRRQLVYKTLGTGIIDSVMSPYSPDRIKQSQISNLNIYPNIIKNSFHFETNASPNLNTLKKTIS